MKNYNQIFSDKKNILVITAHPDDAEINFGGLIARLSSEGKRVRSVVMTSGEKGFRDMKGVKCDDFSDIRVKSQYDAAKHLGMEGEDVINLNLKDGEVENTIENIGKVVYQIRSFKPDIVITHNPNDVIHTYQDGVHWVNHRDHRMTAQLTLDAVYPYSRDRGFFPDHFEQGLSEHSVSEFLFSETYNQFNSIEIDISDYIYHKKKSLESHLQGNVLKQSDIEVFLDESLREDKFFETVGYYKVDRLATIRNS